MMIFYVKLYLFAKINVKNEINKSIILFHHLPFN